MDIRYLRSQVSVRYIDGHQVSQVSGVRYIDGHQVSQVSGISQVY